MRRTIDFRKTNGVARLSSTRPMATDGRDVDTRTSTRSSGESQASIVRIVAGLAALALLVAGCTAPTSAAVPSIVTPSTTLPSTVTTSTSTPGDASAPTTVEATPESEIESVGVPTEQTTPERETESAVSPVDKGVPALKTGSIEDAQNAVGVNVLTPQYLPPGAERDGPIRYLSGGDSGIVSIAYRVGLRWLAIEFIKEPEGRVTKAEGWLTTVGQFPATIQTQAKEPSDPFPPMSEVVWRDADVTIKVSGDISVDELLKVAQSLY